MWVQYSMKARTECSKWTQVMKEDMKMMVSPVLILSRIFWLLVKDAYIKYI